MIAFIIGGMKSGKSSFALREAEKLPHKNFYFIATARATDSEMEERIENHKKNRDNRWITIEEPIDLSTALKKIPESSIIIIDCLTAWLTNLLIECNPIDELLESFLCSLKSYKLKKDAHLFIISNETGTGIIPATELGRTFIDLSGQMNQRVMEIADTAYLIIAGQPLKIK
ncbi:MAG TPA: bifunctional adenosylcobinamide kinase/adenosylcobinamide-phosphate guanylyltransferase [Thermodesulfovibrio thiophilus]|nr:bifunctional adenosylcobinamide kinase/adenosylcobinamide-phosphate guanylyltransferase [Thermodesulfovibrio thiophilus]HQD36851.1 bifunctional adenosylcobinamide kinase/adenosylcobinamide-phosphate guanylyltransferase [Thermodesulfovibrio thiophilus]